MIPPSPREAFVRGPVFASADAQAVWQPKLKQAAHLWDLLERESVGPIRKSALLIVPHHELAEVAAWAASTGRQMTFLESNANNTARVALHVSGLDLSAEWARVWNGGRDDVQIGRLLEFPPCCREFFNKTWGHGARDTSLAQFDTAGTADGPLGCNVLLRYLGVRLVPHLPCSFTCEHSSNVAERFTDLASRVGDLEELAALEELLSLEVNFSSLHGTAVITTHHFKLEIDADPVPAQRGFIRPARQITARPAPVEKMTPTPTTWEDNGFKSMEAMRGAHLVVGTVTPRVSGGSVIDLGCGDGTLLEKLRIRDSLTTAIGLEVLSAKVDRGRKRYPDVKLIHASIETSPELFQEMEMPAKIALFMPGRLLEMPGEIAARMRTWVMRFETLVLYTYGDHGDLATLCEKVDMPKPPKIVKGYGNRAEAGVLRLKGD